ncbi:MAG TPA: polyketide antibiotic transporter, partial [Glaciihabitans sp.]|nr:polyketide antibiotic transporter [Glaciihabitans sp.]
MKSVLILLRSYLLRDRFYILWWVGGITALTLATALAVTREFGSLDARVSLVAIAATNPAFLFLRGSPDGTSIGSLIFFQGFSFLAVLAALMSVFLVVRHTRADEQSGRAELISATRISRVAPLVATVIAGALVSIGAGVGVAAAMMVSGLEPAGSALTGAAVASVGAVFVGVAAIAAQIMPTARGANGLASAAVGIAYLIRGIGDATGTPNAEASASDPHGVSWLSPIGWGQFTTPFSNPTVLPLLLSMMVFVGTVVVAVAVCARRDLGASFVAEAPGRKRAAYLTRSPLGMALRLGRGTLIGWGIGGVTLGVLTGALAPTVAGALASNATLSDLIARLVPGTEADIVDIFVSALLGICGVLAAAAGVAGVMRLHSEESEGRAEMILATPLPRTRWLLSHITAAGIVVGAVALASGLTAGIVLAIVTDDWARLFSSVGAALAHIPAALVCV